MSDSFLPDGTPFRSALVDEKGYHAKFDLRTKEGIKRYKELMIQRLLVEKGMAYTSPYGGEKIE